MTPHGIVIIPPQRTKAPPIVVRRIAGHLAKDRLAVLPTETRYALCAVATSRRALEAVRRARFHPATSDGKPVPSVRPMKFIFRLEES